MFKSASVRICAETEAVLLTGFGSGVVEPTVTKFVILVPLAPFAGMKTVSVSAAISPAVIVDFVHVTGPVPVQLKPPLPVIDEKVTPTGSVSVKDTLWAAVGP
jgi:hypothetical protein